MSASYVEKGSGHVSRKQLAFILNMALILLGVAGVIFFITRLALFQSTAIAEHNPGTWENWMFYGAIVCEALYLITCVVSVSEHDYEYFAPFKWVKEKTNFIWAVTAWFLALGLFPVVVVGVIQMFPHTLYTPDGEIRVMNSDGQVLYPGSSIISSRYSVSGVLVPIASRRTLYFDVSRRDGYVTHMRVSTNTVLKENPTLDEFLKTNRSRLGWMEGRDGEETGIVLTPDTITAVTHEYLRPTIQRLAEERQAQQGAGTPADLLVRSRQVTEIRGTTLPSWVGSLTVRNVEFTDWQHSQ